MSNTINTIATFIVEQLQALGAFAGEADIQMANEIGTLLGDADVNDLKISLDDSEVAISFKSPLDAVKHLNEVAISCGFRVLTSGNGYYFVRRPKAPAAEIVSGEPANTAMAEALARAGLTKPQESEQPAGEAVHKPAAEEPTVSAQPEVKHPGFVHQAGETARAISAACGTEGMSTTAKVAIGVGVAAAVGGLAAWGLKAMGMSLPFFNDDQPATQVGEPVAAAFNFFSR